MRTRRIIHIITTIERGGAENAVTTLAISQAESGHDVSILPLKGKNELGDFLKSKGVKVLTKSYNKNFFRQIFEIKKLRKEDAIFHAHLPRAEIFSRISLREQQIVITRHNSESFLPRGPVFISRYLSRWVTKKAHVIAISHAVHNFLTNNRELHNTSKTQVIYYGYQRTRHTRKISNKFRHTEEAPIRIGTVSRLARQKNIPLLIELTKELNRRGYQVNCAVLGVGPLQDELKDFALAHEVEKHVEFLGKSQDALSFMQSLDMFFLTSNYEGFGLVLLEAMDIGVPIVASNTSAIPEVLGKSHLGLFEVGSLSDLVRITKILLDTPAVRMSVIRHQNEQLAQFSVEKYLTAHNLVYTKLLNS